VGHAAQCGRVHCAEEGAGALSPATSRTHGSPFPRACVPANWGMQAQLTQARPMRSWVALGRMPCTAHGAPRPWAWFVRRHPPGETQHVRCMRRCAQHNDIKDFAREYLSDKVPGVALQWLFFGHNSQVCRVLARPPAGGGGE
jgi:hypothetical protein